nr:unnamed protein product [Callosobruchus chinensis]
MEIMVAAQSRNTLKQYNSTYSKWWDFGKGNIETILQPGVNKVLSFLKQQFDRGLQYSTLNVHRSALNLICDAGKSELVDRFMKGVFKLRPNFPRCEEIWDPESVLKYIISLYPLNKLSLEDLTVSSKPLRGEWEGGECSGMLNGDEWKATSISGPLDTTLGSQSPPQYFASTGSLVEPPS